MDLHDYFKSHVVRQRITEFLGDENLENVTSAYLSNSVDPKNPFFIAKPPGQLDYFLENENDFSRSLLDKNNLIIDLDIEYVNFDFPAEPYLDRTRTFNLQKPIVTAIKALLTEYGISPLHFTTGRGHHFVWQISKESAAFKQLADLSPVTPELEKKYLHDSPVFGQVMDSLSGKAFAGTGLVMEFLVHKIKQAVASKLEIPVKVTDIYVPPQQRGREIISLDISEYGDPLHTRVVRVPFSIYLKPQRSSHIFDDHTKERIPFIAVLPLQKNGADNAVNISQDLECLLESAYEADTKIPEFSAATERLIADYQISELRTFHQYFYEQPQSPPAAWHKTQDLIVTESLPPCLKHILQNPNPFLLKPTGIWLMVAFFLAKQWHPRHIAGLLRSFYEKDYGWENEWIIYDASTRADFYTRVFAALMVSSDDELKNLNCEDLKKSEFCFNPSHNCRIEEFTRNFIKHKRLT